MKPRIFVSSTFYDLKFIREDLSNFIKAHDFEPIMFEDGDVGYTPGKELDTSCYETMKNSDMVLLIIGGEYGSPATGENTDKFDEYISVTRNEYRTAAEAGIPIYVFVEASVYAEYGVYEVNFSNIEEKGIDIEFKATKSINVFRFIREIRAINNKPIQEFRRSADIKSFLSKQWSDMFKNYLALLRSNEENATLQNTVSDMESLIKQMRIMLDAVGKKVIGGDDSSQYNDILQQQNEVEARRICQTIVNGINVNVPEYRERKLNVTNLLDTFKNIYNDLKTEISSGEHETEELTEKMLDSLISNLDIRDMNFNRVSKAFIRTIPEIANSLNNEEVEKIVLRKLTSIPYYKKIFYFEDKKSNELSE